MREAANFLNAMAEGRTLADLRGRIDHEVQTARRQLDDVAAALIAAGLAMWDGDANDRLIVRGRANLLADELADLDRIRTLFDDLERKRDIAEFPEWPSKAKACGFS